MRSAMRMATTLARAQMASTAASAATLSWGSRSTYLGKMGAEKVALILPTAKPISPRARACYKIIQAMVRLRVPMSLSTAISRILSIVSE